MKILDVGSGPIPKLTSAYTEIEIIPADLNNGASVEHQDMEKLTYPNDSFDLVICINALDHTKDAQAAVDEMIRVVRFDGWIYINCALNQLTRHGKKHYWDAKADGTFVNPTGKFDLKDYGFEIECVDGRMIARIHG